LQRQHQDAVGQFSLYVLTHRMKSLIVEAVS
jgi:hypothetical protein